jgi:ABC-type transport system involved in cytochrome bd biosynthesis fused ATPase/permease subunit
VQRALTELMAGRTTFVIAHRLSTIRNADQILVFREGNIVERGTFDELTRAGGAFAELVASQLSHTAAPAAPQSSAAPLPAAGGAPPDTESSCNV